MNWYLAVLSNYAGFTGRARRQEYWMFVLFNFLIGIGLGVVGFMLHFSALSGIYGLVVIIPSIAVSVRRLHDTGKSGLMLLVALIPIIGAIWLLILFFTEGMRGPNQYGPDPKQLI